MQLLFLLVLLGFHVALVACVCACACVRTAYNEHCVLITTAWIVIRPNEQTTLERYMFFLWMWRIFVDDNGVSSIRCTRVRVYVKKNLKCWNTNHSHTAYGRYDTVSRGAGDHSSSAIVACFVFGKKKISCSTSSSSSSINSSINSKQFTALPCSSHITICVNFYFSAVF